MKPHLKKVLLLLFLFLAELFCVCKVLHTQEQILFPNAVTLSYSADIFDIDIKTWQNVTAEYKRKFETVVILGRINYSKKYSVTGLQAEIEAYPKFTKNTYGYFNAGFSNDSIFPKFKAGFELYQGIPYAMEVSGGLRYLKFYPDIAVLLTLSLSKYFRDYLFVVRPYFNLNNKKIFSSLIIGARKYFNESTDYLGVNFSYGNSPDDPGKQTFSLEDIYTLNSVKTWGDFQYRIVNRFLINIVISYEHEEYIKSKYRNKFSIGSGLSLLF